MTITVKALRNDIRKKINKMAAGDRCTVNDVTVTCKTPRLAWTFRIPELNADLPCISANELTTVIANRITAKWKSEQ